MPNEDYAVIIGLQNYPGLGDPPLSGPEYDAQQFEAWVRCPAGGNVPAANVTVILSSNYPGPYSSLLLTRPTELEIVNAFEQLRSISKKNAGDGLGPKVGRRLYLYMSGHGISPQPYGNVTEEESALLMCNTEQDLIKVPRYHIPGNYVASWFCRNDCFDEVFLFMDCCRDLTTVPFINVVFSPTGTSDNGKRFCAFATKWSRRTRERNINGVVQGVFTRTLLLGLKGAAAVANPASPCGGSITFESMQSYLINNMRLVADPAQVEDPATQEPNVKFFPENHKSGIIIHSAVKTFPVTVPSIPGAAGEVAILSMTSTSIIARMQATDLPKEIQLPREQYVVIATVNNQQQSFPLSVRGVEGLI